MARKRGQDALLLCGEAECEERCHPSALGPCTIELVSDLPTDSRNILAFDWLQLVRLCLKRLVDVLGQRVRVTGEWPRLPFEEQFLKREIAGKALDERVLGDLVAERG